QTDMFSRKTFFRQMSGKRRPKRCSCTIRLSDMPTIDPASAPATSKARRVTTAIARYLLGLPLLVFGLNGFINFIPPPETPLPETAAVFVGALAQSGYMMEMIALTLLTVGALLVINRFVPLALVLFAP